MNPLRVKAWSPYLVGAGIGVLSFLGGLVMMLGARIAQGCTSGHAISGVLQLALASWIFAPVMFAVGTAVAFLIYGKEGRSHV